MGIPWLAPTRRALWVCCAAGLLASLPAPAAAQAAWSGTLGAGVAVHVAGSDQDTDRIGLASQAALARSVAPGVSVGLQMDGAWFGGRWTNEKRIQLSGVVEVDVPGSPLTVRGGPGLAVVTVVEADFPPPGTVGDGVIGIGDQGTWGLVAGLGARLALPAHVTLEPSADLVYQRAAGFDVLTLGVGARLRLGRGR